MLVHFEQYVFSVLQYVFFLPQDDSSRTLMCSAMCQVFFVA